MAILKCTCKNEGQDKQNGKGMRVHTPAGSEPRLTWRCTVCLNEKTRKRGE